MSLRFKSLLIFAAAVTLLFGIVLAFAKIVIEWQFNQIEIEQMTRQAHQFSAELAEEFAPLISAAGDWAPWNDLYEYAAGGRPDFPAQNLQPETLANLHLDFLAIFGPSGNLRHLSTVPAQLARGGIDGDQIIAAIRHQHLIPQRDIDRPTSGLVLVDDELLIVAALPIVHSDRSGPAVGTLVIGRIFAPKAARDFQEFSGFRFKILPLPKESRTESMPSVSFRIRDPLQMAAYVPLVDVRGSQIALAELTSDRPLHVQAVRTVRIFVISLASAAGILLFVVWYLLDSNVIHPVRRLATRLTEANDQGELPSDLGLDGSDEIADLAHRIEDLALTVAHAEANYRAIVEDQTEFIFRYQPNGRITFANDALCRYFGTSREALVGLDAHRFVADEDIRRVQESIESLTAAAPVVTLDHRVMLPGSPASSAPIWFRRTDRGIFSGDGSLRELQCVARDITLNHLTHARLEASEIRYRRLFETATDGILIVRTTDHTIIDANPALCRLLESSRAALLGKRFESLGHFKRPKVFRPLVRLLDGSSVPPADTEIVLEDAGGARLFFEVNSRIYENGDDTVNQLTFRDISLRRRATEELRELSGHLLRSQDEERRRIARELHDSTAQLLTALQMALTQLTDLGSATPLDDPRAGALLEEIRGLTDASLREIRTISYLLHPPLLDEVGLLFALRWYVDGFMSRTEIVVRLEAPETLDRLLPAVETAIFRLVQEGLSNIHRHSGSRRAWIRLAVDAHEITLEIRDEGCGLPPGPVGAYPAGYPVLGVGIAGMRERMRQFNGSLTIKSSGNGTLVRATLPLDPDVQPHD